MLRVFKTRSFRRWSRKCALEDGQLLAAVAEMQRGLIDADLGHGLYKKRIALQGRGKRGSTRTLVATNKGDRWIFIAGYTKNEQENLSVAELRVFRGLAEQYLLLSDERLRYLLSAEEIEEILL